MRLASTPERHWFAVALLFEGGLLAVAALLALACRQPFLGGLRWTPGDAACGLASTLPLLALFWWTLHSRLAFLAGIRNFLEQVVRRLFEAWAIWQLALLSALAGLGEEVLFRAVIQGALGRWLGALAGLLLASVLFGLVHRVTWSYAAVATLIGLYFGGLWLWRGNLLVPVLSHGVYDFVALVYFLRFHR